MMSIKHKTKIDQFFHISLRWQTISSTNYSGSPEFIFFSSQNNVEFFKKIELFEQWNQTCQHIYAQE